MTFRPHALLAALLMSAFLSGCGTDTQTSSGNSDESSVAAIIDTVSTSKHNTPVGVEAINNCTNCHEESGTIYNKPPTLTTSAEFETCGTACHTALALPVVTMKLITDTHVDDKATATSIEGYVIRSKADSACRDCHDPHATDLTIQKEWAESGHAGEIVTAGVVKVVKDDTTAIPKFYSPWAHYDWDHTYKSAGAKDRADCQRCHTATGAKNFLANPTSYDPANNDFSHLADWKLHSSDTDLTTAASGQNELLYCWGCHSDTVKGELRNPGALDFTFRTGVTTTFPDASRSNLCIACHSGRETGNSIKTSTSDFKNVSFINSHYLAAAGILYAQSGYEFANKEYRPSIGFRHDNMTGITPPSKQAAVTEKGPCVYCHMGTFANHTWKITNDEACDLCHAGVAMPLVEEGKTGYDSALVVLKDVLETEGFYYSPAHPYFFTNPYDPAYTEVGVCSSNLPIMNWQTGGASTVSWNGSKCVLSIDTLKEGLADTGKDCMGAAYNYNLLIHEPGAFVHNSLYAKRLIFDSIDWLDNGNMDGQITINIAYPDARIWLDANPTTGVATRP